MMISSVLSDLPFRRHRPLKSADDYNIGVFKNNTEN